MPHPKKISFPVTSADEGESKAVGSMSAQEPETPSQPEPFEAPPSAEVGGVEMLDPLLQLAKQLHSMDIHPVVIVGNSNSGKTSLIISLLASLRLEADWGIVANLENPVLSNTTDIGRRQHEDATRTFYKDVQEFIDGKGAEKTSVPYPFFIPVSLRSAKLGQTLNLAFFESNGEAYTPKPESAEFFAALQKVTETFIREFQGGISFIYVLPYTQTEVRAINPDVAGEPERLRLAGLSIVGVLQAYQRIRVDKSQDRHLLLISKWDAHLEKKKHEELISISEVLLDTDSDIEPFLRETYLQALSEFKSIQVESPQRLITNYCAGLMTGRKVQPVGSNPEISYAIRSHQKKLWSWIWSSATGFSVNPFPEPKPMSLTDRFFRWLSSKL